MRRSRVDVDDSDGDQIARFELDVLELDDLVPAHVVELGASHWVAVYRDNDIPRPRVPLPQRTGARKAAADKKAVEPHGLAIAEHLEWKGEHEFGRRVLGRRNPSRADSRVVKMRCRMPV
jgi:hypothetical protein